MIKLVSAGLQSIDSISIKSTLGGVETGFNPTTDRSKLGIKIHFAR